MAKKVRVEAMLEEIRVQARQVRMEATLARKFRVEATLARKRLWVEVVRRVAMSMMSWSWPSS